MTSGAASLDQKVILDEFESVLVQEGVDDFIFAELDETKNGEEIIATIFMVPIVRLAEWKDGHVPPTSDVLKLEHAIGEYLLSRADIPELPKSLVDIEAKKMLEELSYEMNRQGHSLDEFLRSSEKSIVDIRQTILPQANRRARLGLILRKIAKDDNICLSTAEIDEEINKLKKEITNTELALDFDTMLFREYIKNVSLIRKVLQYVSQKIVSASG